MKNINNNKKNWFARLPIPIFEYTDEDDFNGCAIDEDECVVCFLLIILYIYYFYFIYLLIYLFFFNIII